MRKFLFFLYTLIYTAVIFVILPYQLSRRPRGLRKVWLREKFFINNKRHKTDRKPSIWIHSVSVGETVAATPLVNELLRIYPEYLIILTTMTDTGRDIAIKRFSSSERVRIMYMPFDLRMIINRFLETFDVRLFITLETELWPNTFIASSEKGIPVFIVNGRISERSFRGYKRAGFFMKYIFESVTLFMMSSEIDKERLFRLGVPKEKVFVTGNIKFDIPHIPAPGIKVNTRRKILVIASTHDDEERIIIDSINEMIRNREVFIILAPRHPERFAEVEKLLNDMGLSFIRRTEIHDHLNVDEDGMDIMLLNTIGELASFYSLSDIVIMGGSFVPKGGHNILEPAYWSKPVISGPYMHNFPLTQEFFREGGAIMTDSGNLYLTLRRLIDDLSLADKIGRKAYEIFVRNSGALHRTITLIKERVRN